MGLAAHDDDKEAVNSLAAKLGISYTAVAKAARGGRFSALHNAKAALALGVDAHWLATGDGAQKPQVWPFPDLERARFDALEVNQKIEIQGIVRERIERFEADLPPMTKKDWLGKSVLQNSKTTRKLPKEGTSNA